MSHARRLPWIALVAIMGIGACPAGAAAAPADAVASAKRCSSKQVALKFDARRQTLVLAKKRSGKGVVCFKRSSKPASAEKIGATLGRAVWPRGRRYGKLARKSTFKRVGSAAVSALAKLRAGARISTRTVTTRSGPMPDSRVPGGGKVTGTRRMEESDPAEEVGSFTEGEVTAQGDGPGRPIATATQGSGAITDRCPNRDGLVTGSVRSKTGRSHSVASGGQRAFWAYVFEYEVAFVARVNDDARAASMDLTITGSMTFRAGIVDERTGRSIRREPTKVFRLAASRSGVDPRNTGEAPGEGFFDRRTWNARGPKGADVLNDAVLRAEMVDTLALIDAFGTGAAARAVLQAEQYWYGEGEDIDTASDGEAKGKDGSAAGHCIKLAFDPKPAEVEPGQSAPVATRVLARDGSEVAKAKIALTAVTGSVTPAAGPFAAGAPLVATWTAPNPKLYDGDFASFNAVATSNRGRTGTSHTGRHPVAKRYTLEFDSRLEDTCTPNANGGYCHWIWHLRSTVPLEGDQELSGSASLPYVEYVYDSVNGNSNCKYRSYGIGSTPGVLHVTAGTVGGAPSITLHSDPEPFERTRTECPDGSARFDADEYGWAGAFNYQLRAFSLPSGRLRFDRDWQPQPDGGYLFTFTLDDDGESLHRKHTTTLRLTPRE